MNLPNKISFARICMVPLFVILALCPIPHGDIWAAVVFIIASLSDMVDGKIARKYNLVTTLGKFIDPLADKILVSSAFIVLVNMNRLAAWIVIIIICREFAVNGLRILAAEQGEVIAASFWGKLKTTSQMVAILLLLVQQMSIWPQPFFVIFAQVIAYIALIMTVFSGADYIIKGWPFLIGSRK